MFSSVLPHILSVFSVKGKIRENSLSVLGRLFLLKAVSIEVIISAFLVAVSEPRCIFPGKIQLVVKKMLYDYPLRTVQTKCDIGDILTHSKQPIHHVAHFFVPFIWGEMINGCRFSQCSYGFVVLILRDK